MTKVVHMVKQQNKQTNVHTKIMNSSVRYPDRLVGCPLGVPISYYYFEAIMIIFWLILRLLSIHMHMGRKMLNTIKFIFKVLLIIIP